MKIISELLRFGSFLLRQADSIQRLKKHLRAFIRPALFARVNFQQIFDKFQRTAEGKLGVDLPTDEFRDELVDYFIGGPREWGPKQEAGFGEKASDISDKVVAMVDYKLNIPIHDAERIVDPIGRASFDEISKVTYDAANLIFENLVIYFRNFTDHWVKHWQRKERGLETSTPEFESAKWERYFERGIPEKEHPHERRPLEPEAPDVEDAPDWQQGLIKDIVGKINEWIKDETKRKAYKVILFSRLMSPKKRTQEDIGQQFGIPRQTIIDWEKDLTNRLAKFLKAQGLGPKFMDQGGLEKQQVTVPKYTEFLKTDKKNQDSLKKYIKEHVSARTGELQRKTLDLLAEGKTYTEIAEKLDAKPKTIGGILSSNFMKLYKEWYMDMVEDIRQACVRIKMALRRIHAAKTRRVMHPGPEPEPPQPGQTVKGHKRMVEQAIKDGNIWAEIHFSSDYGQSDVMQERKDPEHDDPNFKYQKYVVKMDLKRMFGKREYTLKYEYEQPMTSDGAFTGTGRSRLYANGAITDKDDPVKEILDAYVEGTMKPLGTIPLKAKFKVTYVNDKTGKKYLGVNNFTDEFPLGVIGKADPKHKGYAEHFEKVQKKKQHGLQYSRGEEAKAKRMLKRLQISERMETDKRKLKKISDHIKEIQKFLRDDQDAMEFKELDEITQQLKEETRGLEPAEIKKLRHRKAYEIVESAEEGSLKLPEMNKESEEFVDLLHKYNIRTPNPKGALSAAELRSYARTFPIAAGNALEKYIKKDLPKIKVKKPEREEKAEEMKKEVKADLDKFEKLIPEFVGNLRKRLQQFERESPEKYAIISKRRDLGWTDKSGDIVEKMRDELKKKPFAAPVRETGVQMLEREKYDSLMNWFRQLKNGLGSMANKLDKMDLGMVGSEEDVKKLQQKAEKMKDELTPLRIQMKELTDKESRLRLPGGGKNPEDVKLRKQIADNKQERINWLEKLRDIVPQKGDIAPDVFQSILEKTIALIKTRIEDEKRDLKWYQDTLKKQTTMPEPIPPRDEEEAERRRERMTIRPEEPAKAKLPPEIKDLKDYVKFHEQIIKNLDQKQEAMSTLLDVTKEFQKKEPSDTSFDFQKYRGSIDEAIKGLKKEVSNLLKGKELPKREKEQLEGLEKRVSSGESELDKIVSELGKKGVFPAARAVKALQWYVDYFADLYSYLSGMIWFRTLPEPKIVKAMYVKGAESTVEGLRDQVVDLAKSITAFPITARDQIRSALTKLKSALKKLKDKLYYEAPGFGMGAKPGKPPRSEYREPMFPKGPVPKEHEKRIVPVKERETEQRRLRRKGPHPMRKEPYYEPEPSPEGKIRRQLREQKKAGEIEGLLDYDKLAAAPKKKRVRKEPTPATHRPLKELEKILTPAQRKEIEEREKAEKSEKERKEQERTRKIVQEAIIPGDLLDQARKLFRDLPKEYKTQAADEMRSIQTRLGDVFKEGLPLDELEDIAKKNKISVEQARIRSKIIENLMVNKVMNDYLNKWMDVIRPVEKSKEMSPYGNQSPDVYENMTSVLKRMIPGLVEESKPEKAEEAGIPTAPEIRKFIERAFSKVRSKPSGGLKEPLRENLKTFINKEIDKWGVHGGSEKGSTKGRKNEIVPKTPRYTEDRVQEEIAKLIMQESSGEKIVHKWMADQIKNIRDIVKSKEKTISLDTAVDAMVAHLKALYNGIRYLRAGPSTDLEGALMPIYKKAEEEKESALSGIGGKPDITFDSYDELEKIFDKIVDVYKTINKYINPDKVAVPPATLKNMPVQKAKESYLPRGMLKYLTTLQKEKGVLPGAPKAKPAAPGGRGKSDADIWRNWNRNWGQWSKLPKNKMDRIKDFESYAKGGELQGEDKSEYRGWKQADFAVLANYLKSQAKGKSPERPKMAYDFPTQMAFNIASKFAGQTIS